MVCVRAGAGPAAGTDPLLVSVRLAGEHAVDAASVAAALAVAAPGAPAAVGNPVLGAVAGLALRIE